MCGPPWEAGWLAVSWNPAGAVEALGQPCGWFLGVCILKGYQRHPPAHNPPRGTPQPCHSPAGQGHLTRLMFRALLFSSTGGYMASATQLADSQQDDHLEDSEARVKESL